MTRTAKANNRAPIALGTRTGTKALTIISLLKAKKGATVAVMMEATGWKAHSIRGFMAGRLRKRHGLEVKSEKVDGEARRYRLR